MTTKSILFRTEVQSIIKEIPKAIQGIKAVQEKLEDFSGIESKSACMIKTNDDIV